MSNTGGPRPYYNNVGWNSRTVQLVDQANEATVSLRAEYEETLARIKEDEATFNPDEEDFVVDFKSGYLELERNLANEISKARHDLDVHLKQRGINPRTVKQMKFVDDPKTGHAKLI